MPLTNAKNLFGEQTVQSQDDVATGFLFEAFRVLCNVYQSSACQ